tara:strand:+ start:408 stop:1046 length:639 start_codon:yes stop_codon:yes gene_type:complete
MGKPKLKKQKGGSIPGKSINSKSINSKSSVSKTVRSRPSKSTFDPLNILLLGLLGFLVYHLMNKEPVVKEKVIIREVIKEVDGQPNGQPYREDIYKPDMRQATRNPTFNMKTRGPPQEYDMVGFLQGTEGDESKLQQLYGRRTYPNSNLWNYFVKSDQYHQIPIPVSIGGQNCTDERGCNELQDKGSINLLDKEHTATIYKPEPYYYNPYVI